MSDEGFSDEGGGKKAEVASSVTSWEMDASAWMDAVFDVLADRRRRRVLYCLVRDPDGVRELPDLVADVRAEEEGGDEPGGVAAEAAIERELHHRHLPKLADAGLIDYDPRQGTIRYTGSPGLEAWVDRARQREGAEVCSGDS